MPTNWDICHICQIHDRLTWQMKTTYLCTTYEVTVTKHVTRSTVHILDIYHWSNMVGVLQISSQRHRCKKSPSLEPQFMKSYARSKLQFRIIRQSTNWVKKPRTDWRCNDMRLTQGSTQFWCLKGISKDWIQALFKVSDILVQKRVILTTWFQGEVG